MLKSDYLITQESEFMLIEVVYGDVNQQMLLSMELPAKAVVRDAIEGSGILREHPELKIEELSVGIFSKKCRLDTQLKQGDRVEIYRPLIIDPKAARRLRALSRKS